MNWTVAGGHLIFAGAAGDIILAGIVSLDAGGII
jgi:hypothetical protein